MARYTVYPSRFGYRFDYQAGTAKGKGWRPSRAWAKRVALRRTEAVLEERVDADGHEGRGSAGPEHRPAGEPAGPSTIWKDHGRSPLWGIAAAALAFLVIGAAALYVVQRRSNASASSGSATKITILTTPRLAPTVTAIVDAYRVDQPGVTITVDAVETAQLAKRASETSPDLAIGEAEVVDRLQPREVTSVVPGAFGFDVVEIRVRAGNPTGVRALGDLSSIPGARVGMCASTEACGVAAGRSLDKASVPGAGFTRFPSSAAALAALDGGALDAALVLRTDAAGTATRTEAVALPSDLEERISYDIVTIRKGPLGRRFTDFLNNSAATTAILKARGLLDASAPPPA